MTAGIRPQRRSSLEWTLLLAYLLMVLVGVAFHEPWRDEWRAWMISASATGPAQLHDLLRNEGHPWLWYVLLRPFIHWPGGQAGLALAGLSTGLLGSLLIFFCFRLPLWIRAGVLFSVFWLVEYVVISRSYGLAFAFTSLAILAGLRARRWLLAALLIGLAAHTHLLVALANLPLIALLALRCPALPGRRRLLALVLALVLSLTGIAAAIGPGALAYGQYRLSNMASRVARLLPGRGAAVVAPPVARPRRPTPGATATAGSDQGSSDQDRLAALALPRLPMPQAGLVLILVVLAGLWRRCRTVVLVYSLPALTLLLLFLRFIYRGGAWHQGTVFMVLVYTLVLAAEDPGGGRPALAAGWLDRPWLDGLRRSGWAGRLAMLALSLLLLVAAAEGVHQWRQDLLQPFSGAPAAAAAINASGYSQKDILVRSSAMEEVLAIALQPGAPRPVPVGGHLRPFQQDIWALPDRQICRRAAGLVRRTGRPVLILANGRQGGPTVCPGLRTRTLRFDGLRESLELVEIQP